MTRMYSLMAAVAVFLPIAYAISHQAAQIVA
jgi:hypothetical protein